MTAPTNLTKQCRRIVKTVRMFGHPSSTVACIPSFHSLGLAINTIIISVLWISLFILRLGFYLSGFWT
jgi:hypothetical protein